MRPILLTVTSPSPYVCSIFQQRLASAKVVSKRVESVLSGRSDALQRRLIVLPWNSHLIAPLSTSRWLCRFARTKHFFFCHGLVLISDSTISSSHIFRMNSLALKNAWNVYTWFAADTRLQLPRYVQQMSIRRVSTPTGSCGFPMPNSSGKRSFSK